MTNNPFTQREKAEVLRNDNPFASRDHQPTTYHDQARVSLALEEGGRFGTEKPIVTGSEPTTQFPRLPSSSPWHSDPVPPEEPTGQEIDAQEPTGTAEEINRSLATLSTHPPDDVALGGADAPALGSLASAVVEHVPPNPQAEEPSGPHAPFAPLDGAQRGSSAPTPAQLDELARLLPQLVKRRRSP